jgi:[ribosomal protein S5]-alanine N-acetyltransferase
MAEKGELHRKSRGRVNEGAEQAASRGSAASRVPLPQLVTGGLCLEMATPAHAALHAAHFARNREHFARWDPPRGDVESTEYWVRTLAASVRDFDEGRSVRLVVLPREPAAHILVARVNFTQIARGAFHSCMLGFAVDREFEGRGLMYEAVSAGIDWLFGTLNLHRVQASHRPENERSRRLLERLGFVREGLARDYLFIDGAWRDHVITAKLNPGFNASVFERDTGRSAAAPLPTH